ncbi:RAD protein [Plasmodium cynomolgi strain B]|uniref:RAD protein n=1 Tax=Plasmodium cynomolgi (strain B) TaxID=1120755 RepID=K6UCI4_PLACD|nr:RAD protein [Plasmodium cynomolgi strain B]GAB64906.1 RAD protein [Plasmodium cynomolgi strain B]
MNHKSARLDNVARPTTFKGSLLCLSCLFFLAHPFILAPQNLLPGIEPNRPYDIRILAEGSPSNEETQLGDANPQSVGENITHENSMQESSTQVHQIEPTNTSQQVHPTQAVLPKEKKKVCNGIPRNRLGSYKTSSPNLKNQMNKQNEEKIQSQKNNDLNNDEYNPEQSIKLTEEEVRTRLNNLKGIVSKKDMYVLWFNFHNHFVRRYYAMMEKVWMNAESFASRHNIPQENLQELWSRVYANLVTELRKKSKSCVNDFYDLFDKGECTSDVYLPFLERRKKMWTDDSNMMKFQW